MLLDRQRKELRRIKQTLKGFTPKKRRTVRGNRLYHSTFRDALHLYEDVVRGNRTQHVKPSGKEYRWLRQLAGRALYVCGGQAEPTPVSLKEYKSDVYGPFLGVSDEGSATEHVASAALGSPKVQVLGNASPLEVGVSLDAERLAAVGEVAVGPEEYKEIRLGCISRILTSTNVGTRLNLRYYKQRPRIAVPPGRKERVLGKALEQAAAIVEPFLHVPDGVPRPLTIFVYFVGRQGPARKLEILKKMCEAFLSGEFCDPTVHRLGLLAYVGRGWAGVRATKAAIDLAKQAQLNEVAVEGAYRREAEEVISMPDLLNFFSPALTTELLKYGHRKRITLTPWNLIDPETVARNVWAPLCVARNMGLELGKYGLFPLTLEQSAHIMRMVQGWLGDWTAAPALFVDFPIVERTRVCAEKDIVSGTKRWLDVVAKNAIPVVLIDTANKSKGRKLLKKNPRDRVGIFDINQIGQIDLYARELGIKALWAGGLTIPQAYEMGRLQVFGIYVTTSVSAARPVSGAYRWDRMLPSEKEPTFRGVARAKLLLESGFLVTQLRNLGCPTEATQIDLRAQALIKRLQKRHGYSEDAALAEQEKLVRLTVDGWRIALRRR